MDIQIPSSTFQLVIIFIHWQFLEQKDQQVSVSREK